MKTTTSGRAFAKAIFDIFSTLMISLRIDNHKIRFRSYPNSFTAEAAVANLGNLQVTQSNRVSDPNDPTRIITHVTTTQFSLSRDMARNLCQSFMDARLFESATDPTKREFQSRGLYQVTPKGAHILAKFVVRNSLSIEEHRHVTSSAAASLVHLERTDDEDAIIFNLKQVDTIFKRFAGPGPNVSKTTSTEASASPPSGGGRERVNSGSDLCNGIEVKDQLYDQETYKHTFYGRTAVEWLLDYTTAISKEEAICICQEMVNSKYIEQIGEESGGGPSLFKTGNSALYHLTETGRAIAGWQSLDDSSASDDWMDERSIIGTRIERRGPEANPLSVQFRLTATNLSRLPISLANEKRKSMDEASLSGTLQYNDDSPGTTRRLSQILNDPTLQPNLADAANVSSYAQSSSGKDSVGTSITANGTRLSPPMNTPQSTTSNTSRLNGILSDELVRDLFKSFLRQHYCAENLLFCLEVLDYKTKFSALITSAKAYNISPLGQESSGINVPYPPSLRELEKQICNQAFAIYEMYLVSKSQREVNLPHQMRHDIVAYMQAVVRNMETMGENNISARIENNRDPSSTPSPSSLASTPSSADVIDSDKTVGANGTKKELIHIALFDVIYDHIFRLMSTDSVPKFIKTDRYLEVVMNKHKRNNTSSSVTIPTGSPHSTNGAITGSPTMGQETNGTMKSGNGRAIPVNGGMVGIGFNDSGAGSSRNEDGSSIVRSHSLSRARHETIKGASTMGASMDSGLLVKSSSRFAGIGLAPARFSGMSNGDSNTGTPSSIHLNVQQLRTSRTRSASTDAVVDGMRDAQQRQPHASPSHSNPSYSVNNNKTRRNINHLGHSDGNSAKSGQVLRPGAGTLRSSSASLMDIYTHQQQLQQYSNQRAQLSPAQVQQMFIMRNSRSVPALASSSSSGNSSSSSVTHSKQSQAHSTSHAGSVTSGQRRGPAQRGSQVSPSPQQQPSVEKPAVSGPGQVTVLFESSFSIHDPNSITAPSHPLPSAPALHTHMAS